MKEESKRQEQPCANMNWWLSHSTFLSFQKLGGPNSIKERPPQRTEAAVKAINTANPTRASRKDHERHHQLLYTTLPSNKERITQSLPHVGPHSNAFQPAGRMQHLKDQELGCQ